MIEFHQVNKWFGSLHVLRDIDLKIEAGEVVVVCGPSGSGKSTLIRCINRLETIQSGELIVDGLSLSDPKLDTAKLRANVGMVFQSFNLYPHMTALQNITSGAGESQRIGAAGSGEAGYEICSIGSAFPTKRAPILPTFQVANNNASPLLARSPCGPKSCSSMSLPRHWTRK